MVVGNIDNWGILKSDGVWYYIHLPCAHKFKDSQATVMTSCKKTPMICAFCEELFKIETENKVSQLYYLVKEIM